jgi:putative aldouronate transport system permease protein
MDKTPPRRKKEDLTGGRYYKTQNLQLYSMCVVPLLLIFIFAYLPMGGLVMAFQNFRFDTGFRSEWVGFENFRIFTRSNDFIRATWNTVSLNAVFIVTKTFFSVLVAILLYQLRSVRGLKIYQTIYITPHFLSWVLVAFIAYGFLEPRLGLLNSILARFGIQGPNWYATPGAWPAILTIANVWKSFGMDCVIYYASLVGIDSTLVEAAKIDGANWRKLVRHIYLPHLTMLITILTILSIGGIFRADMGLFFQLTLDSPRLYATTDVLDTLVLRTMRVSHNFSISAAIGLLQSVLSFILILLTNFTVK